MKILCHSMARANLNENKKFLTNTDQEFDYPFFSKIVPKEIGKYVAKNFLF